MAWSPSPPPPISPTNAHPRRSNLDSRRQRRLNISRRNWFFPPLRSAWRPDLSPHVSPVPRDPRAQGCLVFRTPAVPPRMPPVNALVRSDAQTFIPHRDHSYYFRPVNSFSVAVPHVFPLTSFACTPVTGDPLQLHFHPVPPTSGFCTSQRPAFSVILHPNPSC